MMSVLGVVRWICKSFLLSLQESTHLILCTHCCVASHHKLLPRILSSAQDQLHELNYRAKKSLSGIKTQGIDGAIDPLQLSIVSSPVHMSIRMVTLACCFQVSSPASPQILSWVRGGGGWLAGCGGGSAGSCFILILFLKTVLCANLDLNIIVG